MKKSLIKLLAGMAAFAFVAQTHGVTILPTFDSSIADLTNAAAVSNAIMFCIQTFQSNLTDNSTVKILFVADTNVSLGQSATWDGAYSYSNYLTALRSNATSLNDTYALSKLTNSATDPLAGNTNIQLKLPLARLMGLDSGYGPDGYDSTISLNMTLMSATRPPDTNQYDLIGTVEHEMNEVLGFSSNLKRGYPSGPIGAMDLCRYTTNLVRTWTTNGDDAYFSVDGTNLLARFNQDINGDYHDWWSASALWAPPGQTPHVQVQDAFGTTGNIQDQGSNELTALDVIGYTLAASGPVSSPVLRIVRSGVNQYAISWSNSYTGFVLQENTNLPSSGWVTSATGSTNPATITSTNVRKFYRLYKSAGTLALAEPSSVNKISTNSSLRLAIHVYEPRKP